MIICYEQLCNIGFFFNETKNMYELNIYPDTFYIEHDYENNNWILSTFTRNPYFTKDSIPIRKTVVNTIQNILVVIYQFGVLRYTK